MGSASYSKFQCEVCQVKFSDEKQLLQHYCTIPLEYSPIVHCQPNYDGAVSTHTLFSINCTRQLNDKKEEHRDVNSATYAATAVSVCSENCIKMECEDELTSLKTELEDMVEYFENPTFTVISEENNEINKRSDQTTSSICEGISVKMEAEDGCENAKNASSSMFSEAQCTINNKAATSLSVASKKTISRKNGIKQLTPNINGNQLGGYACKICRTRITCYKNTYNHVLSHLKSYCNIDWLYKCNECGMNTMYKRRIHDHIIVMHNIERLLVDSNVHYENREHVYETEIKRFHELAFSKTNGGFQKAQCSINNKGATSLSVASKKTVTNKNSIKQLTRGYACKICRTIITCYRNTYNHVLCHLKSYCNIDWLYKCNKCVMTTMYKDRMQKHLIVVHSIERLLVESNVHYENRELIYENEIKRFHQLAFPQTKDGFQKNSCNVNNIVTGILAPSNDIVKIESVAEQSSPTITVDHSIGFQCQICQKIIRFQGGRRRHSLSHLKSCCNVDWLFKCNLCDMTAMFRDYVVYHIADVHNINRSTIQSNIHFESRIQLYQKEIRQVHQLAFGDNSELGIATQVAISKKNKNKWKNKPLIVNRATISENSSHYMCEICKMSVRINRARAHAMLHLENHSNIDWLYKCNLCGYATILWHPFKRHLLHVHKLETNALKSGVHYEDRRHVHQNEIDRLYVLAFPILPSNLKKFDVSIENDELSCFGKNSTLSTKNKKSFKRVCQICQKTMASTNYRDHTLTHFKEISNVEWLFKCNFCNYVAFHRQHICSHLIRMHGFNKNVLQPGDYYEDRMHVYHKEIDNLYLKAFPKS